MSPNASSAARTTTVPSPSSAAAAAAGAPAADKEKEREDERFDETIDMAGVRNPQLAAVIDDELESYLEQQRSAAKQPTPNASSAVASSSVPPTTLSGPLAALIKPSDASVPSAGSGSDSARLAAKPSAEDESKKKRAAELMQKRAADEKSFQSKAEQVTYSQTASMFLRACDCELTPSLPLCCVDRWRFAKHSS